MTTSDTTTPDTTTTDRATADTTAWTDPAAPGTPALPTATRDTPALDPPAPGTATPGTATLDYVTMPTPAGPLTIVSGPDGRVRATGFTTDVPALVLLIHPRLRGVALRQQADLGDVTARVRSYLDGDLTAIDDVPVQQHTGGEFMAHAWAVMRGIKAGEPVTHTRSAEMSGRPAAVRAAAAACARNAVAFFVPRHPVLRTDHKLGRYPCGLEVKRWLLDHEARA